MGKSLKKRLLLLFIISGFAQAGFAQNVGFQQNTNPGLIRIAEPGVLADTLNVWGDVKNTGKFIVPRNTNLTDLISYARGPGGTLGGGEAWSKVKVEIYISHYNNQLNKYQNQKFDIKINDPLPPEMKNYPLMNGDLITLKTKKKPSFRDYFTIIAPVLSLGLTTFLVIDRFNRR